MKKKSFIWIVLIVLAAAGAFGWFYFFWEKESPVQYRTAKVERGSLSVFINANGTVNPVTTVLVGSQVSGTIQKLFADYNSIVKSGQLIAQIDPAILQGQVSQARAKVENAKAAFLTAQADIATSRANIESSKANVLKAKVAVLDTKRSLNRSLELFQRNLVSASDRDAAQTAFDSASAMLEATQAQLKASEAQLESAQARLESARASVRQAEAELGISEVNLAHTRITAPVNGIVISRNVDVGQTVAASLQAPTLFTIAQDLTDMQVDTNVSEADIGRISADQESTFTVDAFPQINFKGKVTEVRNAPLTIQNVVTYDVVIQVRNPELKLRPGMTANVSILVAHKENVLKISNASLRFRPDFAKKEASASKTGAEAKSASPPSSASSNQPLLERLKTELNLSPQQQAGITQILQDARREVQMARKMSPEDGQAKAREMRAALRLKIRELLTEEQKKKYDQMQQRGEETQAPAPVFKVWTPVPNGRPVSIDITTGISDGSFTEILSGSLKEGQEVIVEAITGKKSSNSTNPPNMKGFR